MKTPKCLFSITALMVVIATFSTHAANVLKANNNTSLDQGGSWSGGAGPAPGISDIATWDSTVATAANCTNTLAANTNWGGIQILNPVAPVQITGVSTLFLGSSGIDLNEAGTSQSLFLNLPVNIFANQNWSIESGQTLTFGTTSIITTNNTVTVSGNVACNNGFGISGGGTLIVSSGNFTLVTNFVSTKPLSVGADGNGGTLVQNGGTVSVSAAGGTSGSYVVSLPIGGAANAVGTYDLNAGTLTDITSNKFAYCSPGNASGATGTLNISGGSASFYSLRIGNGNGNGFVNITNGTLTVAPGEFSIGRGSSGVGGQMGTFNVYGGTVSAPGISVNLPKGFGNSSLSMYGGSFNVGNSLGVPAGSTGSGTLNMYGGILTVTNNLNLPGGGTGTGTVNLNGGTLCVSSVGVTTGGASSLQFNGGILKARNTTATFIASNSLLTVDVDAGGAIIDTTNVNVTIPAALMNGTGGGPDGGLTKLGSGTLTLSASNSYNGPTMVGGGTLALSTTNNNTVGALIVSNTATLATTLAAAGTSLNCSSLTEGVNPGDTVAAQFNLGSFGNPATPVINATSLTVNGTVNVSVNGSGFSIGTIPLIRYTGSVFGSGTFVLQLLAGASGYVTNNTTSHTINLVVTGFPNLTWRATASTNWDLTTVNWVDTNNSPTVYVNGATVNFNDSASNTLVNLTNNFSPAVVNVANVNSNYTFAGTGSIGGAGGLNKTGAGLVVMALTNSYAGNTVVSNGTFKLGVANPIPSGASAGNVTLNGKLDLAGFNQSLNGLSGNNGVIDNSGTNAVVLAVGNNGGVGTFAGQITNSGSSLALNNVGGGLTLLSANYYTGGTTVGGGVLQLASPQSIGTGPLTLNGGTLDWANASAQTLTNPVTVGGSITLGAATNGPLAITSTVNFNNAGRGITCNSDVLFAGGMTNGTVSTKSGSGDLILTNTSGDWASGSVQVSQGRLLLTGAGNIIVDGNNLRVQCNVNNGLAELTVTNGASLVMSNSATSNLRVGASDTAGAAGCTNILDVAGTVNVIAYSGTGNKLMIGGASSSRDASDIVNLFPGGILTVCQITNTSLAPTVTTFNFDGGTLVVATNQDAVNFFDAGILDVNVLDNGATIDTAGYSGITFNNDLVAAGNGTGSFTKNGAGQLILAGSGFGTSTYGGATIVNGGTLTLQVPVPDTTNFTIAAGAVLDISAVGVSLSSGESMDGSGGVLGSVTVNSGAVVAPGTATAAGTLTFSSVAPSLGGAVLLKLDKGSAQANDQIAVSSGSLNYGGTLTVSSIGATPAPGDKFYLFSASGYGGSFSSVTLPMLPAGLGWTNNLFGDGSITVTGVVSVPMIPRFNSIRLVNGNLVLSGTNGTALQNYYVLSSTNLLTPLGNWKSIATNSFDGSGNFNFTNPINLAKPVQFFDISVP